MHLAPAFDREPENRHRNLAIVPGIRINAIGLISGALAGVLVHPIPRTSTDCARIKERMRIVEGWIPAGHEVTKTLFARSLATSLDMFP